MAAVVVTAQNIRLTDAEATTHFGDVGGGQGGSLETDFFYQNTNCYARKGGTSARGIFHENSSAITSSSVANPSSILCGADHELVTGETVLIAGHTGSTPSINGTHVVTVTGATTFTIPVNVTVGGTGGTAIRQHDLTVAGQTTVMFKAICTTPGLLDPKASDGWQLAVGSGQSDYYLADVHGNDTYPIRSSWLIVPVDMNVSAYRDETVGTPVLTTGNYFGLEYDQNGTSKSPNQGMDAVDVGAGLTLVGGDGGDTDGVWADFIDFDEGTVNNRFGYATSFEGVLYFFGQMVIGSASATVFSDASKTIVFPDGLFAQGFSGITVDLQSATTDVDFIQTVFLGKGSSATEETRPQLLVTGTSGNLLADTCTLDSFDTITLTSGATLLDSIISNTKQILLGGGALTGCTIFGADTADGVAFIDTNTLANIATCDFTFSDGHAIEITATGTYSFVGNKLSGYGGTPGSNLVVSSGSNDAFIYNNSGGLVTINISGGGDTPAIRNGAGATTVVNNDVAVTFDEMKNLTEVRVYEAGTTTELAGIEIATAGSDDDRNFVASVAASTVVDYTLVSELYEIIRVEDFTWPTADQTIIVAQRLDGNFVD